MQSRLDDEIAKVRSNDKNHHWVALDLDEMRKDYRKSSTDKIDREFDEKILSLFEALKNNSMVTEITIAGGPLLASTVTALADLLRVNENIISVDLKNVSVGDSKDNPALISAAKDLGLAIANNHQLQKMRVTGGYVDQRFNLDNVPQSALLHDHLIPIIEGISKNSSIKETALGGVHVSEKMLPAIIQLFQSNTTITEMKLGFNIENIEPYRHLIDAFKQHNASLNLELETDASKILKEIKTLRALRSEFDQIKAQSEKFSFVDSEHLKYDRPNQIKNLFTSLLSRYEGGISQGIERSQKNLEAFRLAIKKHFPEFSPQWLKQLDDAYQLFIEVEKTQPISTSLVQRLLKESENNPFINQLRQTVARKFAQTNQLFFAWRLFDKKPDSSFEWLAAHLAGMDNTFADYEGLSPKEKFQLGMCMMVDQNSRYESSQETLILWFAKLKEKVHANEISVKALTGAELLVNCNELKTLAKELLDLQTLYNIKLFPTSFRLQTDYTEEGYRALLVLIKEAIQTRTHNNIRALSELGKLVEKTPVNTIGILEMLTLHPEGIPLNIPTMSADEAEKTLKAPPVSHGLRNQFEQFREQQYQHFDALIMRDIEFEPAPAPSFDELMKNITSLLKDLQAETTKKASDLQQHSTFTNLKPQEQRRHDTAISILEIMAKANDKDQLVIYTKPLLKNETIMNAIRGTKHSRYDQLDQLMQIIVEAGKEPSATRMKRF